MSKAETWQPLPLRRLLNPQTCLDKEGLLTWGRGAFAWISIWL